MKILEMCVVKFIKRIWNLNDKVSNKEDKKIDPIYEKKFLSKFNEYLFKILKKPFY